MDIQRAKTFEDMERQRAEIAHRLRQAREGLRLTQLEFAAQISITRDRLASYEDGRAPVRCDVALRACRQFFISEFWLALGAVDEQQLKTRHKTAFAESLEARLSMALALDPLASACPLGISLAEGFEPYLRQQYSKIAATQNGFPRIIPLAADDAEYCRNALNCLIEFWKRGLTRHQWEIFFSLLNTAGRHLHGEIKRLNPQPAGPAIEMVLSPLQSKASGT